MHRLKWILLIALFTVWTGCHRPPAVEGEVAVEAEGEGTPTLTPSGLTTPRRGHVMTTVGGDMVLVTGGVSLCVPSAGAPS